MLIKTKRLELRPMAERDLDSLVELLTDDIVKKTYMVPDFPDREAALATARRIRGLSEDPDRFVVGVYLGEQLIGMMNDPEISGGSIEVGYALLSRFHGQGYCTEAMSAAIGHLFTRGFSQVVAGAFEDNVASLRVMQKSGMRKIDKIDEIEYRGKTHRCIYYLAENPETRDT